MTVTIKTKDDVQRCYHDVCQRDYADCPHEDAGLHLDSVPLGV